MTSNSSKIKRQNEPLVTYQFIGKESDDNERLNRAFDILFEEVLKRRKNKDLTTNDN